MKVWFGCSTAEFEKYQQNYFAIRDFVVAEGHVLTRDWIQRTYELIKAKRKRVGTEEIYRAVIKAINDADVLIVEDTISNFSTGHQITLGLQRRKPVLVLWQGQKNKYFDSTMLHGVSSDYLQISQYDMTNYQSIIRGFIKKYEHAGDKYRFNLVIDEVERQYLEWAKYKHHKSRTQLIKESLRSRIDSDEDYQSYLSH
jgi:antirestriction protein